MSATRVYAGQCFVQILGSGGQVQQTCYSYVNYLGHIIISDSTRCSYSLKNSSHTLRTASINSQLLFDNKFKKVAKSNLEAQQHRLLATSANYPTIQPQKSSYAAAGHFRKSRQPTQFSRPKQNQSDRSKNQSQS